MDIPAHFFFAVFVVRGLLPWIIIWATMPTLGPIGSLTAAFSNNPSVHTAVEKSAPILLLGGGIFLIFLFFHWLFLETKNFGLRHEKFFQNNGAWFFAVVSILLATVVWYAIKINPMLAFYAVIGSTAFFITHGFKENAEKREQSLLSTENKISDISKIDRIKKYAYLKNGAMYSIFVLGIIMMLDSFGVEIPSYISPVITFIIIGFFIIKSVKHNKK